MSKIAKAIKPEKAKMGKTDKKLTLFIVPFIILCFLFSYFPLHGWIYAFYDYKPPLPLSKCEFVGLQWFEMLFNNKTQVTQMIQVMKNTFAMSLLMSLLGIATSMLPLFFAIFLNEIKCKWFRNLVQTLTTLPNFISWVLVYSVAFSLFSNTGMVNTVLQNLGLIRQRFSYMACYVTLEYMERTWMGGYYVFSFYYRNRSVFI